MIEKWIEKAIEIAGIGMVSGFVVLLWWAVFMRQ